jgi:hypothetical protein
MTAVGIKNAVQLTPRVAHAGLKGSTAWVSASAPPEALESLISQRRRINPLARDGAQSGRRERQRSAYKNRNMKD